MAIIIISIVLIGNFIFNRYLYYTSNQYKLKEMGYNTNEVNTILGKNKKIINKALKKYDKDLVDITNQAYFIYDNYNKYKKYISSMEKVDYAKAINLVNVKRNYDYYTHTKKANTKIKYQFLVNKYYYLSDTYIPNDLVDVSNSYCYGKVKITKEAYEAFKEMYTAAKKEGITLIINSGYRSYDEQVSVYNQYRLSKGDEYASAFVARPGYSEHQTGLAIDVFTYGYNVYEFDQSKAFKWLSNNAYKYGFIMRYPSDKEDITGFGYESWHYRYIGKNNALNIHQMGLTLDEYYAYYLERSE